MPIRPLILYFLLIFLFVSCKNNQKQAVIPRSLDPNIYVIEDPEQLTETQYYVWLPFLYVRAEPNQKSALVTKLKKGDLVKYLGIKTQIKERINIHGKDFEEPWMKVITPENKEGWVFGAGINIKDMGTDLVPTPYDDCFLLLIDKEVNDFNKCSNQVSKQQYKLQGNKVLQNSKGLTLSLKNGKRLSLESDSKGVSNSKYEFWYYFSNIGYYVVREQIGNHFEYLLINNTTGHRLSTWGFPKPSPGKNFIVSTSSDIFSSKEVNGIQILTIEGSELKVSWQREVENYEPYMPKWLDNNTIGVTLVPNTDGKKGVKKFALIRRQSNNEWKMEY
jgi:hypothetical protein